MSILISIHHLFSVRLSLCPGDEFALRDGGSLYCKEDHDVLEKSQTPGQTTLEPNNNNITSNNNNTSLSNNNHSSELGSMSGENRILRKELLNTPDHQLVVVSKVQVDSIFLGDKKSFTLTYMYRNGQHSAAVTYTTQLIS